MLTETTPSPLAGCTIDNDDGKRWRIIGPAGTWEMTPAGLVTARQAEAICKAVLAMPTPITPAAADVLAERRRQVEAEGWTPEHDDQHSDGELAQAAAVYAHPLAIKLVEPIAARERRDDPWPWHDSADVSGGRGDCPCWGWVRAWFKPRTRRRDLVRAAALLLAEIERLDRLAATQPTAEAP